MHSCVSGQVCVCVCLMCIWLVSVKITVCLFTEVRNKQQLWKWHRMCQPTIPVYRCQHHIVQTPLRQSFSCVDRFLWIWGWWVPGCSHWAEATTSCTSVTQQLDKRNALHVHMKRSLSSAVALPHYLWLCYNSPKTQIYCWHMNIFFGPAHHALASILLLSINSLLILSKPMSTSGYKHIHTQAHACMHTHTL